MADTIIPATALSRVLDGAAVATKAPDHYVQPLATWLRQGEPVRGNDSPMAVSVDQDETLKALSFHEWREASISHPDLNSIGVKQLTQLVLAIALLRARSHADAEINSAVLDTIWDLVYDAIVESRDTELQFVVSRSAQGFLSVPLCSLLSNGKIEELWRFHTWMPDNQRGIDDKVGIHAHQAFGQSWTLLGSGTDCAFDVDSPADSSLATHAKYELCFTSADGSRTGAGYQTHQMKSAIRSSGKLVRVREGPICRHSRDDSYSVPAGAYHHSDVPGRRLHATLFVFDAHRGYDDNAGVLGPKEGGEYVQLRDPAGITAVALAQIADATRKWEQAHDFTSLASEEHPTVLAYYRFFRGMSLLEAGCKTEAMHYLNATDGLTPLQAFAKESSVKHREYIKQLIRAGVDPGAKDKEGRTALEYARQGNDSTMIALLS